jgi:hypothetical protein
MRSARDIAITLAVATAASGCSGIFVEQVPAKVPAGERIRCTRSRQTPILDSVLGAAATAGVVGASVELRKPCGPLEDCLGRGVIALFGLVATTVLTAMFAGSAAYGYVHTARCRAAKRAAGRVSGGP